MKIVPFEEGALLVREVVRQENELERKLATRGTHSSLFAKTLS
jgi:uncharacterized small protein (DUF1192 family)